MPFVQIETKSQGLANINYIISTPTSNSAQYIDESLPTLLLFHAGYVGIMSWHQQFADPQLRRFNLVALDFRAHGETGGIVTSSWGQEDAAEDAIKFMDALKLKKCYLVALSMGTITAIQLAVCHPERVLGMFLVSPLGLEEIPDVTDGREQIYDTWVQAFREDGTIDLEVVSDAAYGVFQLAFNNQVTPFATALTHITTKNALPAWGFGKFENLHNATVKFFNKRKGHSKESLSRICCPVKLLFCLRDVAYDINYVQTFFRQLKDASVNVSFDMVDAAHFGMLSRPELINPMLADFIALHTDKVLAPIPESVTSPFEDAFTKGGLKENDDENEDDLVFHFNPMSIT